MKKDFIQNILEKSLKKRKERIEENKIIQNKIERLSIVELNNYEQIIDRNKNSYGGFYLTLFLIKFMFFSSIFFLASIYFYGNGIISFRGLFEPVFSSFMGVILITIIIDIVLMFLSPIMTKINNRRIDRLLFLKK